MSNNTVPIPTNGTANGNSTTTTLPFSPATLAIHADDPLNTQLTDVAPPIHVSTTFRYPSDPTQLQPFRTPRREHCYSRHSTHSTTRLEQILSSLLKAPCITYSSGLSALHSFLVHLTPKRVSVGAGYHGNHGVLRLHTRLSGLQTLPLSCPATDLEPGDLILLETPVNPTGLALDIAHHAAKAHSRGAYLLVDSTFAPPPLQDPFALGADAVMHSGTKYIGGHSDMLCGVVAVREGLAWATPEGTELPEGQKWREGWVERLLADRVYLGTVMGGLEGWLGVRSVRTMELRVLRQSENAAWIVERLGGVVKGVKVDGVSESDAEVIGKVVKKVEHASLQEEDLKKGWLRKQMAGGFGPVFAITLKGGDLAKYLPSKLHCFHHATSLGGVESLIEWRTMTDATVEPDLLRVSIGIEQKEDLYADLVQGFKALVEEFGL